MNVVNGLISRLYVAKEIVSELEGILIGAPQTEMQRQKKNEIKQNIKEP